MSIIFEQRGSDSPYIETVTQGRTASDGSSVRPAECHWHMVLVKLHGNTRLLVVGPWTTAGVASWSEGAELLWIKFRLGAWMPHLPTGHLLDRETILPTAARQTFWLNGAAWQYPDVDNVETFINRLVRDDVLVLDPVVSAVADEQALETPLRTVRHRFLRTTGLSQSHIRQVERAGRAAALLGQGASIPDTVFDLGYFDQPHLTKSLHRFVGKTPAQIQRSSKPEELAI